MRRRRRGRLLGQTPAARPDDDLVYAGSTAAPTPSASATLGAGDGRVSRLRQSRLSGQVDGSRSPTACCSKPASGSYSSRWGGKQIPGLGATDLIRIVEQCATGCAGNGNIPNLTYRSGNWSSNINWNTQWNAGASFVTGSHSIKVGYQGALLFDDRKNFTNSEFLQYRFNNGMPDQLTLSIACLRRFTSACAATRSSRRSSGRWAG